MVINKKTAMTSMSMTFDHYANNSVIKKIKQITMTTM